MTPMLTCKEVANLVSFQLDQPPPLMTRLKIRLHLGLCKGCRQYKKQIIFLHRFMNVVAPGFDDAEFDPSIKLSDKARLHIRNRISG